MQRRVGCNRWIGTSRPFAGPCNTHTRGSRRWPPRPIRHRYPGGAALAFCSVITVKYRSLEPYSQMLPPEPFRPFVAIRLHFGGRHFDTRGLIDSGADDTVINS